MWGFYCSHFYYAFSHKSLQNEILDFYNKINLVLKHFFEQLSSFKPKFPNCIFFWKGWIESQRTKMKMKGIMGGDFKFHTKTLLQSPILFGLQVINPFNQFLKIQFQYQSLFLSFLNHFLLEKREKLIKSRFREKKSSFIPISTTKIVEIGFSRLYLMRGVLQWLF